MNELTIKQWEVCFLLFHKGSRGSSYLSEISAWNHKQPYLKPNGASSLEAPRKPKNKESWSNEKKTCRDQMLQQKPHCCFSTEDKKEREEALDDEGRRVTDRAVSGGGGACSGWKVNTETWESRELHCVIKLRIKAWLPIWYPAAWKFRKRHNRNLHTELVEGRMKSMFAKVQWRVIIQMMLLDVGAVYVSY